MTPFMKKALKSVKAEHGKYSEIMVYGPDGWSTGRLIIDPFSEKMYGTQGDEFEAIRRMQANGMSLSQSLEQLVLNTVR